MKVQDVLSDESRWCQGVYAIDDDGRSVDPGSPKATRFCLLGAMARCRTAIRTARIVEAIENRGFRRWSIATFNDSSSFDEVRKLIEELDL